MPFSPRSPKNAKRAWALLLAAGMGPAGAFSPDGEALLDALRGRISAGRGGEEGYQEALRILEADPESDCSDWAGSGAEAGDDPALGEALRGVCPEIRAAEPGPRRKAGSPRLDFAAAQGMRPRAAGAEPVRWSAQGAAAGLGVEAAGRGSELRRRAVGLGFGGLSARAGHLGGFLEATRLACVAGRRSYAGVRSVSGLEGPLASDDPGLDGAAFSARSGPWRLQTAGAWNRIPAAAYPRTPPDTPGTDAGLFVAGLAHAPSGGPETRAQAFLLRLEKGADTPEWLAVAGIRREARSGGWRWRASAAASGGLGPSAARPGAFAEGDLAYRDLEGEAVPEWDAAEGPEAARWRLRLRQAAGGWANPLQSPARNPRDTGEGWGGARLESAFPLARAGAYSLGLRAGAGADWIGTDAERPGAEGPALAAGRADGALIHAFGPFLGGMGGSLGWGRSGSGVPPAGGWRLSLGWRRGPWRGEAALSRREDGYAGTRPMPLELSWARLSADGSSAWSAAWSAADARDPAGFQRLDCRQDWPGEGGVRIWQRLRAQWPPEGASGGLSYQLGLTAEL